MLNKAKPVGPGVKMRNRKNDSKHLAIDGCVMRLTHANLFPSYIDVILSSSGPYGHSGNARGMRKSYCWEMTPMFIRIAT